MNLQCRFCGHDLKLTLVDLGMSPLSNSYLRAEQLNALEHFFPLHVRVCEHCWLAQLPQLAGPEEIFQHYAYFSSYSDSMLRHARQYVEMMIERFQYGPQSLVAELASNDGYLLQYFKERAVPVLGIEPAANVAEVAEKQKGIPSLVRFFGVPLAKELVAGGRAADLIVANNVLAHVPDINDFVGGMKIFLKPGGVVTVEFPHLLQMIRQNLFDTIYHEHYSYLSLVTVQRIFARHGLTVFDVEEVSTHGGSLRIFARHAEDAAKPETARFQKLLATERQFGLESVDCYRAFDAQVRETKRKILDFCIRAKREGKTIAGYGAPAKAATLLNYCGIRADFVDFTVDRSPHKQGCYLPGVHLPIYAPEKLREVKPDYVFVFVWNLLDEVCEQMGHIREWGGKFVTPLPEIRVID